MNSVVIVAAGKGTRMGEGVDKLFLNACGEPVIVHSWRRFDRSLLVDEIVLVIREERREEFLRLGGAVKTTKPFRLVAGGAARQDSVWNGLEATSDRSSLVAIHDGARPCVSEEIIKDCFEAAGRIGASVAAQRVTDTLKEASEENLIERNIDRSRLWAVQTPQVFRRAILKKAMAEVRDRELQVTDDTAACEAIGQCVFLVESVAPNPKVTVPSDLPFVEWLLSRSNETPSCSRL